MTSKVFFVCVWVKFIAKRGEHFNLFTLHTNSVSKLQVNARKNLTNAECSLESGFRRRNHKNL